MIDIRNLNISFQGGTAIRDLSLRVGKGETLGIAGESGSGKSLLLRALLGLPPESATLTGEVRVAGTDLLSLTAKERARFRIGRIGMVFQEPMTALNPLKRVGELIAEPLRLHLGLSRAAAQSRAVELLTAVELPDPAAKARQYPHELSGGQRQRVVLAMALALEPQLLLADEPTTALDAHIARQILALLQRLTAERQMTLLLVSHDLSTLARATERLCVLYGGDIVENGPTAALLNAPRHPYTQGLLAARPVVRPREGAAKARFITIPGTVPALKHMPKGCRFAGRCPRELALCASTPPLMQHENGRSFACHNPEGVPL